MTFGEPDMDKASQTNMMENRLSPRVLIATLAHSIRNWRCRRLRKLSPPFLYVVIPLAGYSPRTRVNPVSESPSSQVS